MRPGAWTVSPAQNGPATLTAVRREQPGRARGRGKDDAYGVPPIRTVSTRLDWA
jgi:hypothetical protein